MDGGTLITVIMALAVAFAGTLIDKSLKKAGRGSAGRPLPQDDPDLSLPVQPELSEIPHDFPYAPAMTGTDPADPSPANTPQSAGVFRNVPEDLLSGGYKSVRDIRKEKSGKIVPADKTAPASGKLHIDRKKLIVYSEIMNPKWR